MAVNMMLAALLMSGMVQTGQPMTLGGDAISQSKDGAPAVMFAQAYRGKPKMNYKGRVYPKGGVPGRRRR